MAIRVALNHQTEYQYDRLVTLTPQIVRLRPAPHARTPILSYSLKISPTDHFLNWQQDPYSNYLGRLVFNKPTKMFKVEVDLVADMTVINPFDFFVEEDAQKYPFVYDPVLAKELIPYLEKDPGGPKFRALVQDLRRCDVTTVDYLVEINSRLSQEIKYLIRMEPGVQTPEETLTLASGSCRDTGWLQVQILRHLGMAARFVSGYLIQLKADVKALDGPSGTEVDFTDLHAWAEVYIPGAGWIGLDATSGLLAGEGHIPLACAADPLSAAPITGSFAWTKDPSKKDDECVPTFAHSMKVTRVHEDPRVTKPYREEEWERIVAVGHLIDDRLEAGDVRLTMGGEPTFVSIDDRDGAEWNMTAMGPTKRLLSGRLIKRLREKFSPGGLLHYGQGKWYPGESLPRWAPSCHWRRDGVSVWEDPDLIADESRDYGFGEEEARTFANVLIERLGVDSSHCLPGYEDVWYYLWKERRLPVNVNVFDNNLEDPEERRRVAKVFDQGLDHVVGFAVPLRREYQEDGPRWVSGPWFLRREQMYLLPGDSAMGYRLPLDALPWATPEDTVAFLERDPFAPREALPSRETLARSRRVLVPMSATGPGRSGEQIEPPVEDSVRSFPYLVRTALCVEPREGRLYIFMPPQGYLEDYLDLVAAVEDTARDLQMPILVEGYPPPSDHRMNRLSVTPDPGVIEVNVHPAHSWDELVEQGTTLYEERVRRGSGPKNSWSMAGTRGPAGGTTWSSAVPRPPTARSCAGPTCSGAWWLTGTTIRRSLISSRACSSGRRARRPGSTTRGTTACMRWRSPSTRSPIAGMRPWLVDRVFRHLLVDVTGSTHRAEFCIDKLYSPDTGSGRQGLVELRAFEMPPHPRMSLVQQLLIRGLIARFWEEPYHPRLVRLGTELHDRFVLPHFVAQDFHDVIDDLRQGGLPLEHSWFDPHFEFRFPFFGKVNYRGVDIELRQAIEPWHVLGEEATTGGAVRYVDSSVERLQVKVEGMTDTRHVVTCNGRRLPLHPTGTNGEFVAGVRYRAWRPPSCLHPTIPVHAPLVFDLVDTWMNRSDGGFTYHVSHPGGRSHDTFPINANEAEGRRFARYVPFGHTPGPMFLPPEERNPELPFTLDLRRAPG